jgi:hypothetical protein
MRKNNKQKANTRRPMQIPLGNGSPALIPVDDMPTAAGLELLRDHYVVCSDPVLLGGMPYPNLVTPPWRALSRIGFRWVVCLADEEPCYDPHPLELAFCCALEDLAGEREPSQPSREIGLIRDAVNAVIWRLTPRHGVILHCMGGRGRTGTVLGCVLRDLGVPAAEVIAYLDNLHKARGREGWPESPWQQQVVEGWERTSKT